jgi:hypothetical protein
LQPLELAVEAHPTARVKKPLLEEPDGQSVSLLFGMSARVLVGELLRLQAGTAVWVQVDRAFR